MNDGQRPAAAGELDASVPVENAEIQIVNQGLHGLKGGSRYKIEIPVGFQTENPIALSLRLFVRTVRTHRIRTPFPC